MKHTRIWWRGLALATLALGATAWIVAPAPANPSGPVAVPGPQAHEARDPALATAQEKARLGRWAEACKIYDELLRHDRSRADLRQQFHYCFRRYQQVQRHRDATYRDVLGLSYSQALRLYEMMLAGIQSHYVDRSRPAADRLFRQGLDEFRHALEDRPFLASYWTAGDRDVQKFNAYLGKVLRELDARPVRTPADVLERVRDVAMTAQRPPRAGGLGLNATATVLEFACGACTALDEYSFYLTPRQLSNLSASIKGSSFVGVGIELYLKDMRLLISRVLPGSPADAAGLKPEDQLLRIGTRPTAELAPEAAMDLLKGDVGSTVELTILTAGMPPQTVALKRQKLTPRSVESGWVQNVSMSMATERTDIGYVRILHFQKTTPQELDAALLMLREGGMRALILDLRGNPGGSFEAAVDSARRFLSSGVIVTTRKQDARVTRHLVRNGAMIAPVIVPMAVLVDGDTASAAEILAGALRDNDRAKLVGQTTFGKGCSQKLLQLTVVKGSAPVGAIRITVATFLSPSGEAFSGRGIVPHVLAERHLDPNGLDDNQLFEAKRLLMMDMKMNS